jgi:hypothetical protein
MAAIITDDFRKQNIENFFNDVFNAEGAGGTDYYVGLGRTQPYEADADGDLETSRDFSPPTPTGSLLEKEDVKNNLMTLIKVKSTDIRKLVPQVKFEVGQAYKVYNPNDPTCFDAGEGDLLPCYALYTGTDGKARIYMCLGNNNGNVTTEAIPNMPAGSLFPYGSVQNATDKYIWSYIDTFRKDDADNKFSDSRTFVDLHKDSAVDAALAYDLGAGYDNGRSRAAQASAGLLYGFAIDADQPGKNYPGDTLHPRTGANALDAIIVGEHLDGTTITENNTCTVETGANGQITKVNWTLAQAQLLGYGRVNAIKSDNTLATGLTKTGNGGIAFASLVINDTEMSDAQGNFTGAEFQKANIQPLILPRYGLGASPQDDLPSYYAGISADFKETVGLDSEAAGTTPPQYIAEALVDVKVREVSLIKDTHDDMIYQQPVSGDAEDDSPWPGSSYVGDEAVNCLQFFQLNTTDGAIQAAAALANAVDGAYIEQVVGSGQAARAWFDQASRIETGDPAGTGGFRVYFHQNRDRRINKIPFTSSGQFTLRRPNGTQIGTQTFTYAAITQPEYQREGIVRVYPTSQAGKIATGGDVLFTEFRAPITRNAQQTEEVRLIIQF